MLKNNMLDELNKRIAKKLIEVRKHPNLPISIYNYSIGCEINEAWDEYTLKCRGLVLDDDGNIVIDCVPKFFNQGTKYALNIHMTDVGDNEPYFTEKLDGYMIQIKNDSKYGLIVTSKGSFDNQYVEKVYEIIGDRQNELPKDITFICELLHDFPGDEGIIVTTHNETRLVCWEILNRNGVTCIEEEYTNAHLTKFSNKDAVLKLSRLPKYVDLVKRYTFDEAKKYMKGEIEGIVLLHLDIPNSCDDKTGGRVKCKTDWFLRMHRAISGCTKKAVWELLANNSCVAEAKNIPDEFLPRMIEWENEFRAKFDKINEDIIKYHNKTKHLSKKELGLYESSEIPNEFKHYIYNYRNGNMRKIEEHIWKTLKPKNNR